MATPQAIIRLQLGVSHCTRGGLEAVYIYMSIQRCLLHRSSAKAMSFRMCPNSSESVQGI